jgi:hypothetical protein
MKNNSEINPRLGVVGGQAVLEGVMMRHKNRYSVSVRRENGEIVTENREFISVRKKIKILNIPIIRGTVNFIEMMILSYKTLSISAEAYGIDEEEEESKFEKWLRTKFGKSIMDIVMVISTVLGLALGVCIFFFLPIFLTKGVDHIVGGKLGWFKNLVEGIIKVVIFIAYLWGVSFMSEIKRTFEYHGAEHKSIFCYESGEELTPENAKKFKRFHPRCGTSFMFVMIAISIIIYSLPFVTWDSVIIRFLTKLAMLPIVVGAGYEFLMYAGKHDNRLVRALSAPGLWMQRITTREPDLDQLAVAIEALKSSMPEEFPEHAARKSKNSNETVNNKTESIAVPEKQDGTETENAHSSENTVHLKILGLNSISDTQKDIPDISEKNTDNADNNIIS